MPIRILHSLPQIPSTCFFCGTKPSRPPKDPRAFKCQECQCWNRYDENGEIMSDEPAMHDESLNAASFAKRASPSKNRFPTKNAQTIFCRTCLTNQTLLINLLSNYLPAPDDPSYETLLAEMPEYKTALEARYPPVCKDCEFSVAEAIKSKEHMARTSALGTWLKRSQVAGSKRPIEQQHARREILLWRVRGVLWVITLVLFLCIDVAGIFQYDFDKLWMAVLLPLWSLVSVFWAFWDPTWSTIRLSQLQGRGFSVAGRQPYIYCQSISWMIRLSTSIVLSLKYFGNLHNSFLVPYRMRTLYSFSLLVESALALVWITKLQIKRPPKIRLLDSKSQSNVPSRATSPAVPPSQAPSAEALFANLSFTPHAAQPPTKHVFGQSSFPSLIRESDVHKPAEDMMDWTPANSPDKAKQVQETWLRPQKFFPPERPTGLEDLFQKAARLNDDVPAGHTSRKTHKWKRWKRKWDVQDYKLHIYMLFGAIITVILGLAYMYLQRFFMSRTSEVTYVQLDDL